MARKVPISSLTVGRCFSHSPDAPDFEEPDSSGLTTSRSVMAPENVWKVTGPGAAENARGETQDFDGKLMVVEVPRGGFNRLVERVADPSDPLYRG